MSKESHDIVKRQAAEFGIDAEKWDEATLDWVEQCLQTAAYFALKQQEKRRSMNESTSDSIPDA